MLPATAIIKMDAFSPPSAFCNAGMAKITKANSLPCASSIPIEKALLAVLLISYLQPFEDGNKRTGRMVSNAILIGYEACPLSYRSVEAMDYKKAFLS